VGDPAAYLDPELSPDDSRVAVSVLDSAAGTRDIWIYEVARNTRTRLSTGRGDDVAPVWSPDGGRVAFASIRDGRTLIVVKPATGDGPEDPLPDVTGQPTSWSPDGRHLLVHDTVNPAQWDVRAVDLSRAGIVTPYRSTAFTERNARFSADGTWIVFSSWESGDSHTYVASFPEQARKWPVWAESGIEPRWRRDGREVFLTNRFSQLMAVDVRITADGVEAGAARRLFDLRPNPTIPRRNVVAASSDGQRFLVNTIDASAGTGPVTMVLNWAAGLGR
jgi:eukaryotic-like serine/threonine-protein kinase